MTQLVMPLKTPGRFTFDTLALHDGIEQAVTTIRSVFPRGIRPLPALFIYGPNGTGKTHIIKSLIGECHDKLSLPAESFQYIPPANTKQGSQVLEQLVLANEKGNTPLFGIAIDDVHLLGENEAIHLWNLSNKLTRVGGALLLTSKLSPEETFPLNPHLISRVLAGLVFELAPPPEHVRLLIMDKLARDRNVQLSQNVTRYLLSHTARNVKELEKIIDMLDSASLEYKRRITIPFIKFLEEQGVL